MRYSSAFLGAILAAVATAEIFKFPLPNGFPNVTSASAIQAIEHQAGGPLPVSAGGIVSLPEQAWQALQALAFNEIFEVAFFTQLLQNVTESRPGYELGDDRDQVIAALNSSQGQEQLHALNANMGLKNSKNTQIEACEYEFPVSNFTEAMAMADNFATLLIAAVAAVITDFGASPEIVTLFSSILGQEGQQDGYFRWLESKVPNENPFLISTTLSLLYNHIIQHYVVPGSCPQSFPLPTYNKLLPLESPPAENTTISFSTTQPTVTSSYYIAYMSGQIAPVVVPISKINKDGDITKFDAAFPFDAGFSRGLTVATLVSGNGPFMNVSQVADSTLAGPGLIQGKTTFVTGKLGSEEWMTRFLVL